MTLRTIRLELARTAEFPEGSAERGYEFVAPLPMTDISMRRNGAPGDDCTVHRFWVGEDDVYGRLVHHRGHDWAFHYDGMGDEEEEPIFRFDRHRFVVGEYVSITEHDGVQRTFRVAEVLPAP